VGVDGQDGGRYEGPAADDQPRGCADCGHAAQQFFLFQENNLGSIAPGKFADILVIDRDYLTVPADEIKGIKPLMTIPGGRVVYDADAAAPATK
jgi:amidohydrolase family protein